MIKELCALELQHKISRQIAGTCRTLLDQASSRDFKDITIIDEVDVIFGIMHWARENGLKAILNESDATVLIVGFKD